jgi:hypothetical protein
MTVSQIKVKVVRNPVIKIKAVTTFPYSVAGDVAISVSTSGGAYRFKPDYTMPGEISLFDPANQVILAYDRSAKTYSIISLASLASNVSGTRVVTEAGDITVAASTRVLVMNRGTNESPSRIYVPDSDAKIGDLLVVDWKGNAGSFPHDVYMAGTDKVNGNLSSWRIGADGASVRFSPIPNLGYAV